MFFQALWSVTGQAGLRGEAGEHRRAALGQGRARRGRHLRRRASRRACPWVRRRRALRRRDPQRQLHRRPRAVPAHERGGDVSPAGGGSQAWGSLPPRLDRRGLRRPGPGRPRALHRGVALSAELSLQLHEGLIGHARARLGPHVRPEDDHLQLLEQLRPPTSMWRSSSPGRSPTSSTKAEEEDRHRDRARHNAHRSP